MGPHRPGHLVRVGLGRLHRGDLDDRPVDEVVGDGVAVERRLVLSLAGDRVDRLEAAVVLLDDAFAHQRAQRPGQPRRPSQVDVRGEREAAAPDRLHQRLDHRQGLGQRHRPPVVVQQAERHQGGRGDRGGRVDPVRHLEGHSGDHLGGVGGAGSLRGLPQRLPQRERLPEADVRAAPGPGLGPREAHEPAQALGGLRSPGLLEGQRLHLGLLVVDDGDRHQEDVVGLFAVGDERIHQVAQHPHPRRAQLAGPGPTTLEVPLEVRVLPEQVPEVQPHHRRVHGVVARRPADEDQSAAPAQLRHRPHREVDAAEDVVGWQAVRGQRAAQDERVEVGPVVGQEHQRVLATQLTQLRQRAGVGVDGVGAGQPLAQPVPGLCRLRTDLGGHLLQARLGVAAYVVWGAAGALAQRVDRLPELLGRQDRPHRVSHFGSSLVTHGRQPRQRGPSWTAPALSPPGSSVEDGGARCARSWSGTTVPRAPSRR